jgi:hypothetical protein
VPVAVADLVVVVVVVRDAVPPFLVPDEAVPAPAFLVAEESLRVVVVLLLVAPDLRCAVEWVGEAPKYTQTAITTALVNNILLPVLLVIM